ncbi:MAG: thermonuclease family protein [Azonexaceae bacterium]|nr:thermonuclease family protein [Azonexaceae bacterium]
MKQSLTVFLLAISLSQPPMADTLHGRVVGVSDGDTITVLDASNVQFKVRLAGIDAPEKSQAFGNRSKENLSNAVFGKAVDVDWSKTDKYGRTVGKVVVGSLDANLAQLRNGFAWHYKKYEKEQSASDRAIYAKAESEARAGRIGLWQDANPIPPWDFRHSTGDAAPDQRLQNGQDCPCGSGIACTGPKGGTYCMTTSGKKKY